MYNPTVWIQYMAIQNILQVCLNRLRHITHGNEARQMHYYVLYWTFV